MLHFGVGLSQSKGGCGTWGKRRVLRTSTTTACFVLLRTGAFALILLRKGNDFGYAEWQLPHRSAVG